jgi:branched-chain amino acid transport system ATP-binding protein
MSVLLETRNLNKRFGGIRAVSKMNLVINEGEILGLIGPNGAGKTTFFNLISGFLKPDSGSIYFNGEEITRMKAHEICRKGIARTFQLVKPFSRMTVLENVKVAALSKSKTLKQAESVAFETLNFLNIFQLKDKIAGELPVGYLKLLEVAKALATKPKLLLLDEPIAGLNPFEVMQFVEVIKKIQKQRITIFLVEHVIRFIMPLCDRLVVMHYGEKIAEGSPIQISKDPTVIQAYLGVSYA